MKAVINTSVLISLGKLGYLKLIRKLFDRLVIAESVFEEVKDSEVFTQVSKLTDTGFAEVAKSSKDELLNMLSSSLGRGEAETIALALELETDVALLDDLRARKTVRRLKVKVMGTLAILKALIDMKLIREKDYDLCEKLIAQGFWIEEELCMKILGDLSVTEIARETFQENSRISAEDDLQTNLKMTYKWIFENKGKPDQLLGWFCPICA